MESIIIEIRAAEGGIDSSLLVADQYKIYRKWVAQKGLTLEVLEEKQGFLVLQVSGKEALASFKHEAGGHRFQRCPPTERKGRIHTSTITVAVLPIPESCTILLRDSDLDIKATVGTGPGGQNRNKTASAIQMTHKPTGLSVRIETERSQRQNLLLAKAILAARIQERATEAQERARNNQRKAMLGAGARGDKRRTTAFQRGQVTDHFLDIQMRTDDYLKGDLTAFYGN
jgi:peptide chain release factor 1